MSSCRALALCLALRSVQQSTCWTCLGWFVFGLFGLFEGFCDLTLAVPRPVQQGDLQVQRVVGRRPRAQGQGGMPSRLAELKSRV